MLLAKLNGKPEVFYTIQGEGPSVGIPAIFIRLAGCNLHCDFCDTSYTWRFSSAHPHKYKKTIYKTKDVTINLTPSEAAKEIYKLIPKKAEKILIVITGGEPLLQQKEIAEMIEELDMILLDKPVKLAFEIETNGTLLPTDPLIRKYCRFNVSPKLSGSGNEKMIREVSKTLKDHSENPNSIFKFVITSEQDRKEVLVFVRKYKIKKERVDIMPEGITVNQIQKPAKELVEFCKKHGFNFTTRLHILIYGGAKRGI